LLIERNNGRLIDHHFIFMDDQRIGCAKVYGDVASEKIKEAHGKVPVSGLLVQYKWIH
jgi:hypothetical protein